jgi:acetate kinase
MYILVINCGSSSVKAAVVHHKTGEHVLDLKIERLGQQGRATAQIGGGAVEPCAHTHEEAMQAFIPRLLAALPAGVVVEGVGHRAVHGGTEFTEPVRIDDAVIAKIEGLATLAPLHTPANLAGIRTGRALLPDVPHVAVFDTAFHATLPRRASTYAIPQDIAAKHGIRRYGFHGTSHAYVANKAAEFLGEDVRNLRIITCHLGSGASVCAVEYGRSVETSMGMTPLEGLVMGTRAGDIDPGVLLHLMRVEGLTVDELDELLNKKSGLAGLSGVSNDMRDLERRAAEGDDACRMAIQVFTHQVRKYIGAYAAVMGGVDAIVFTAGIGENSETVRHRIAQRLDFLGAYLDEDLNRDARVSKKTPVLELSNRRSRVKILAIHTDELHAIAEHAAHLVMELDRTKSAQRTIPVAVSARHVHLRQETVEALFGPGYKLTELRPLSQPGQYACNEVVTLIGPKRKIEKVRVLGPVRPEDQVEISRTDEFFLGVDAPVRASGDIANTPGIVLEGPAGRVEIKEGVICAWRHIHMHPDDAEHFGVKDKDVVEVEVGEPGMRSLIFKDVLIRVSPKFKLEMHIDTDEGNAAELTSDAQGALVSTLGQAQLKRRRIEYDKE